LKRIAYILLFPVAQILTMILEWIGIIFALLSVGSLLNIDSYFESVDYMKDETGNVTCQYLFNVTLIKSTGEKFGTIEMKISQVLANNRKTNTLTLMGRGVCWILVKLNDPAFT
jgi:hypothetical protein